MDEIMQGGVPQRPPVGGTGPIELLTRGFSRVREQYWLWVGVCFVAFLLAALVPFYILLGPAVIGVASMFRRQDRGLPLEFGQMFRGFDYFTQSLPAALLLMASTLLLAAVVYVPAMIVLFATMSANDGEPAAIAVVGIILAALFMMVASFVIQSGFTLSFPLVFDRDLAGMKAVREGWKAFLANKGTVLLYGLVAGVAVMIGALACYVGVIFVLPIVAGGHWELYRSLYPELATRDEHGEWPGETV